MFHGHRQQPGLACEDCRRRKARCDRVRPSCGSCNDGGISCRYIDKRPQRGPKKGQMMGLKRIIADLEQRLGEQTRPQRSSHDAVPSDKTPDHGAFSGGLLLPEQDTTVTTLDENLPNTFPNDPASSNINSADFGKPVLQSYESNFFSNPPAEEMLFTSPEFAGRDLSSLEALDGTHNDAISDQVLMSDWTNDATLSPSTVLSNNQLLLDSEFMRSFGDLTISALMQADLDELYFERIHPISPNIHRRRYFAWAKQKQLSAGQTALQHAMRAVAAAMSAQYRPLSSMLCAESRRILEQADKNGTSEYIDTGIEQIQAWLLIAHWELLCNHEHEAVLTAGRVVHMVQVARLHILDARSVPFMPTGAEMAVFPSSPGPTEDSFVKAEEQRRTFWLAYCLDRFCSMHSECPLSLQEESIRTRLPSAEINFQNNKSVQMDYLSEALVHSDRAALPAFANCVVLHSLFSRCISHQRFAMSESDSNGSDSCKIWSKYAWLALAVEKRKGLLIQSLSGTTDPIDDTMLTFATALATCAATEVYQSMAKSTVWATVDQEDTLLPQYNEQAIQAARELVRFIESKPRSFCCFRAHPFLPGLIYRAAFFLVGLSRPSSTTTTAYSNREGDLGVLLGALKDLEQVNSLSRNLLCKLEKQDIKEGMPKYSEGQ